MSSQESVGSELGRRETYADVILRKGGANTKISFKLEHKNYYGEITSELPSKDPTITIKIISIDDENVEHLGMSLTQNIHSINPTPSSPGSPGYGGGARRRSKKSKKSKKSHKRRKSVRK